MNITKLISLGVLSLGSALAMPLSALACGGGPATAAELAYLRSVEERPAEAQAAAATTTPPTRTAEPRHHAAGRRHASATPRR
jgi:hypothetical protein